MRNIKRTIVLVCVLFLSLGYASGMRSERDVLFQVSTINALMNGVYDGIMTICDLKKHGDFGLGTVDALDGEMLAVDGKFYQIKTDGVAYLLNSTATTPFAAVTFFDTDQTESVTDAVDINQLEQFIDSKIKTKNIFYAVRIDGKFDYIKTRSVPIQKKPYPPLLAVVKNQTVFEFKNVEGVIVGLRCPDYANGVNVPGYHFHFITADRKAGGHLLYCKIANVKIQLDDTFGLTVKLPESGAFLTTDLSIIKKPDVAGVER